MKLKRLFYLVLLGIAFASYIFPYQWPVENPGLITSFAENRNGRFSRGIEIVSPSVVVKPVSSGEVVFFHKNRTKISSLPSPLGNFVILQHDRGIFSFYGHLKELSVDSLTGTVSRKDSIGTLGASGESKGGILFFALLDSEFNQFVNPLLSLPSLRDTIKPDIGDLFFRGTDGQEKLQRGNVYKSGTYEIIAEIKDFTDNVGFYSPLAPYSIDLYINGELKKSRKFESLKIKDNNCVLQNLSLPFRKVYAGKWLYNLGKIIISPGSVQLELSVKDFEGNEAVRVIKLKIAE